MFGDLFEDVVEVGGAFVGGGIGADVGKKIASDVSDGDPTVEAIGTIAGGLLGASVGHDIIENIFEDED